MVHPVLIFIGGLVAMGVFLLQWGGKESYPGVREHSYWNVQQAKINIVHNYQRWQVRSVSH